MKKTTLLFVLLFVALFLGKANVKGTIEELAAPVVKSPTGVTPTKFTANWEAVEGATMYLLNVYSYVNEVEKDFYLEDEEVEGTSCRVEQLNESTTYYYTVKAKNSTNVSSESEEMKVEIPEEGEITAPVLLEPTNVSDDGFTANWESQNGVTAYWFYLIETRTVEEDNTYVIMNESFDKVNFGSISNPSVGGMQESLDGYTELQGWEALFPLFAKGMIGMSATAGFIESAIFSPRFDLHAGDGSFRLELDGYTSAVNDKMAISKSCSEVPTSEPEDYRVYTFETANAFETITMDFVHENEFAVGGVDFLFSSQGQKTFIDNVKITKDLKAGESFSYIYKAELGSTGKSIESVYVELDPRPGLRYSYSIVILKALDEYPYLDFLGYENKMEVPIYVPLAIDNINPEERNAYLADGVIYVELKNASIIEVYDVAGKLISKVQGNQGVNTISISNRGIYIVKTPEKVTKLIY